MQEMTQTTTTSITTNDQQKTPTKSFQQPLSLETLFPSLNINNNQQQQQQKTPISVQNLNKNYRFDEMILDTGEPVELCQIQLPCPHSKSYVTDDGLIVPCITNDMKSRLFDESYKLGYTKQRQIECIGRSCTEMALQLLGGPIRFQPKNYHQKPKVLLLANNEIQGAYAICTARLLSIRNVIVYIFINNSNNIASQIDSECVQNEIRLLNQSDAKHIKSIEEIQNIAIDLIINSIDSGDNISINSQLWYRNLVKYCSSNKASVISIDPSTDGGAIQSKLSIVPILPQVMSRNCGRIYLCDLGFTKKVFDSVNIKYQSPFGAKFLIPLYDN
jgi:enhancer of mRNA-decapping protein 3